MGTPVHALRRALDEGGFVFGDARKMVREMLAALDVSPAPRRLLLGAQAYTHVRTALQQRLAELEAQQGIALSTEMDAG